MHGAPCHIIYLESCVASWVFIGALTTKVATRPSYRRPAIIVGVRQILNNYNDLWLFDLSISRLVLFTEAVDFHLESLLLIIK